MNLIWTIGEIKEETLECMKKFVEDTPKARIILVNEHKEDQAKGEIFEYFEKIIEEIYDAKTDLIKEYDEHEETQEQTSNDPPQEVVIEILENRIPKTLPDLLPPLPNISHDVDLALPPRNT